jgi:hypothetical protein
MIQLLWTREGDVRVAEIVVRDLEKTKPDKWGYVQVRDLRSTQEERQVFLDTSD